MNFVALLLGLGIERLLTQLFHLREFRWLDSVFDRVLRMLGKRSRRAAMIGWIFFTLVLIAPVGLISITLVGTLYQVPYFVLAVIVLLFSLGPRDLKEEVNDYCAAVEDGRAENVHRVARELIECDPPDDSAERVRLVERAVFVQANNRIFGVVFWFLLLGPTGAWLFRVLDMMRRRLAFQYSRHESEGEGESEGVDQMVVWAVRALHGIFAWLPARLLSAGYAMAGSFEDALSCWRKYNEDPAKTFFQVTNDVMACIGRGAVGAAGEVVEEPNASAPIRQAMDIVSRTLWLIWCPIIAILTLSDWLT
jgi:AmpE protein